MTPAVLITSPARELPSSEPSVSLFRAPHEHEGLVGISNISNFPRKQKIPRMRRRIRRLLRREEELKSVSEEGNSTLWNLLSIAFCGNTLL